MPEGSSESKRSSAARMKRYRERMRAKGLRPVVLWVPDLQDPAVRERIRQDCEALRDDPQEKEIMVWIDAVRDTTGWE